MAGESVHSDEVLRWFSAFPGAAIVTLVMAFNFVGDGVRDALDAPQPVISPRVKGVDTGKR